MDLVGLIRMVETREAQVKCARFRRAVVGEPKGKLHQLASRIVEKSIDDHNGSRALTIKTRSAHQRLGGWTH